jgi:hypothetical protein
MQQIKWFFTGMIAMAGLGGGVVAVAAPGDLVYEAPQQTAEITAQEAGDIAQEFIDAGAWDGAKSDMVWCRAERSTTSSTGFLGICIGLKSAPAASLPVGDSPVQVVGIVE